MIEIYQADSDRTLTNMEIGVIFRIYSKTKKTETARKVRTALNRILDDKLMVLPQKIYVEDIEERRNILHAQGVKGQTLNTYCNALSGFWSWAIKRQYTAASNPFELLDPLPEDEKRKRRDLTDEEVRRLLEASTGESRLRWALHLYTGLRKQNVDDLTWSMLEGNEIVIPGSMMKGSKEVSIPICKSLREILSVFRQEAKRERVFMRRSNVSLLSDLKRDCKAAGVDPVGIDLHALRHTFATKLWREGVSIKIISILLGHKSVMTTERYLHIDESQKSEALEGLSY